MAVHLRPGLGRRRLKELSVRDVQLLLNAKHSSGSSPRTVERIRAVLRQALGQAVRQGLITRNAAALARAPRMVRHPVVTLSPDTARSFLEAVRGTRGEALYTVALALGLRQGEALGLPWDDVDLEFSQIRVTHALQRVSGSLVLGGAEVGVEPQDHTAAGNGWEVSPGPPSTSARGSDGLRLAVDRQRPRVHDPRREAPRRPQRDTAVPGCPGEGRPTDDALPRPASLLRVPPARPSCLLRGSRREWSWRRSATARSASR